MNESTTVDTLLDHDPYTASSRVTAAEGWRMDEQFRKYSLPALIRVLGAGRAKLESLRVLDAGSGYGSIVSAFENEPTSPRELRLLDTNRQLLGIAERRALDAGLNTTASVLAIDAGPLPETCGGNDIVLASFVLTHVTDLARALTNLARSVRPGGRLLVADVDYCASTTAHDEGADEALSEIQGRLAVKSLATALPRLARDVGLYPCGIGRCQQWIDVYVGSEVRDDGLQFIRHFHSNDPARAAWSRIGPNARLELTRLQYAFFRP